MQNEGLCEAAEVLAGNAHGQGNAQTQGQALSVNAAVTASPLNGSTGLYQPDPLRGAGGQGRGQQERQGRAAPGRPPPLPPYPNSYTNRSSQPSGMRVESPTGGVQVTIDAAGSWSQLARQDATLPTDANAVNDEKVGGSSGGVFGIFGRKKGRGHSPKPKERGVLGKEGARVVIG
jgi:serine/threonine kinase 32